MSSSRAMASAQQKRVTMQKSIAPTNNSNPRRSIASRGRFNVNPRNKQISQQQQQQQQQQQMIFFTRNVVQSPYLTCLFAHCACSQILIISGAASVRFHVRSTQSPLGSGGGRGRSGA